MSGLDGVAGRHEITTPAAMEEFGERLGALLTAGDVIVLTGALGAGKTTLTRGIAAGLGVRGPVQSPTFVLARTHPSLGEGPALVHVDAYRLGSSAELEDLDLDLSGSVVVAEWGRGLVEGLLEHWWEIEIERPVGGRGADTMCGGPSRSAEDLDADAPRVLTLHRRP